jgi:hypothetical protein
MLPPPGSVQAPGGDFSLSSCAAADGFGQQPPTNRSGTPKEASGWCRRYMYPKRGNERAATNLDLGVRYHCKDQAFRAVESGLACSAAGPRLIVALDAGAAPPCPVGLVSINNKEPKWGIQSPELLDHPLTMGRQRVSLSLE